MQIQNKSERPARLIGDLRLLWFEVEVPGSKPGKTKLQTCRLPNEMVPSSPHRRTQLRLAPGAFFLRQFDPRLYCFSATAQQALMPGSVVTPRFGWPDKTKTTWQKGRKVEVSLPAEPPFVAVLRPAHDGDAEPELAEAAERAPDPDKLDDDTGEDEAAEAEPLPEPEAPGARALKNLRGNPVSLGPEYRIWATPRSELAASDRDSSPLSFYMARGSDAEVERDVMVTVGLENRDDAPVRLYFRRELTEFIVLGPKGVTSCAPPPQERTPDPLELITLRPKQKIEVITRLEEVCPYGTFSASGLYKVTARLPRSRPSRELPSNTVFAEIETSEPALVRVRKGTRPILIAPVKKSSTAPADAATPPIPVPVPAQPQ